MKGLYWLAVGVRKSTMVERARMMDMEMDSHIAFKVRMQRDEMNTYSQLTIIPLHFYTVRTPGRDGATHSHSECVLLPQLSISGNTLTDMQKCAC